LPDLNFISPNSLEFEAIRISHGLRPPVSGLTSSFFGRGGSVRGLPGRFLTGFLQTFVQTPPARKKEEEPQKAQQQESIRRGHMEDQQQRL
jgi:hypothetical protein